MPAAAARRAASSCAAPTRKWPPPPRRMLGATLVTAADRSRRARSCTALYVEKAEPFVRALYLGFVLDRKIERIRVIASAEGGVEIEEIAASRPETILQQQVDPAVGLQAFQARELAFGLGLNIKQVSQAVTTIMGCYRAFRDLDATMVEINPLVVTKDDRVLALDAKMSFDDNAHVPPPARSPKCAMPPRRIRARRRPRSSASTTSASSGDIGCIINGAGLAMATMDMIKHAGGEPANFLDVGGGASPERVAAAFNLVLSDQQRQGDPGQHLRRHQPLRLGRAGRGAGRARACACRWSCALPAPTSRRAGASSPTAGCPSSRPTRWRRRPQRPSRQLARRRQSR